MAGYLVTSGDIAPILDGLIQNVVATAPAWVTGVAILLGLRVALQLFQRFA